MTPYCGFKSIMKLSLSINYIKFNPLSNTALLLTLSLIGSYHEMITCLANCNKALKMMHHRHAYEIIFLTPSLIGSINYRIFFCDQSAGSSDGLK